ncbi:MAG: carboxypeptidase regulatory-like domain-containing protein [Candidatus Azobacteroides sp.]|nr:carboxypeptidase regulatory-like domain-containing protein [Candidatus Azobacteroides sp.]
MIAFICVSAFCYSQEGQGMHYDAGGYNDETKIYIGNPHSKEYSQLIPFNSYYPNNIVQTLYYEKEIGKKGLISAVEYYYSFEAGHPVLNKTLKIYMSVTQKDNLYEGWITQDTVLVYEGSIDLFDQQCSVTIPLQQPFLYDGGNLLITTMEVDTRIHIPINQFLCSPSEQYRLRATTNLYFPVHFGQMGQVMQYMPNISLILNTKGAEWSGVVTDERQQPLPGAIVEIQGKSWKKVTNAQGKYTFDFIPAADYVLLVSKAGYLPQSKTGTMEESKLIFDFALEKCPVYPVKNLAVTLHAPQWNQVKLSWEQPDSVTAENQVTGYKVYVNHLPVSNEPIQSRTYVDSVPPGQYLYEVSAVWNSDSESPALAKEIEMTPETIVREYPFKEGFESGQIPASWEIAAIQNNRDWEIGKEINDEGKTFVSHSGQYFAYLLDEDHYSTTTRLITPMLDLHALSNPHLSFWHLQAQTDFFDLDSLAVFYKNNPDGKWKYLAGYGGKIESWKKETIPLPEASGTYWIAFKGITMWGHGLMLDDVEIYDKKGDASVIAKPVLQDRTEGIRTFPNPVQNRLTISGENIEKVEIYNILGGKIDLVPFNGNKQQQIDMHSYETGIYLLKIYLSDGKFATKRIVVK